MRAAALSARAAPAGRNAASEVRLRPVRPGDLPEILELLRVSLGEGAIPRSAAYWRWKHEENPFGASSALVAVAGEEIVGLRAFLRWRWCRAGAYVDAVRAVDTATHPAYRGRGIFTRLTLTLAEEMAEQGVSFVFNTPNEKSRPGYLKMGWKDVGRVSLWVRPLRPARLLLALARRGAQSRPGSAAPGHQVGDDAGSILEAPETAALLAGLRRADERWETPRSLSYLRWRYAAVPGFEYRAAYGGRSGDGALVVFRDRARRGLRELRICELLVRDTTTSVREGVDLLRELLRVSGADYAVAMGAPGTPERRVLRAARFLPAPRLGPILTVRELAAGAAFARRETWRHSIGDLELF